MDWASDLNPAKRISLSGHSFDFKSLPSSMSSHSKQTSEVVPASASCHLNEVKRRLFYPSFRAGLAISLQLLAYNLPLGFSCRFFCSPKAMNTSFSSMSSSSGLSPASLLYGSDPVLIFRKALILPSKSVISACFPFPFDFSFHGFIFFSLPFRPEKCLEDPVARYGAGLSCSISSTS